MRVKELMAILQDYDPELLVVVDGYEGGYWDAKVKALMLKREPLPGEYYIFGPHDDYPSVYDKDEKGELHVHIAPDYTLKEVT